MQLAAPALSVCPDALAIGAEHIVNRIKQPGDDLDALRLAARSYLLDQIKDGLR